jgi:hypothetical protein
VEARDHAATHDGKTDLSIGGRHTTPLKEMAEINRQGAKDAKKRKRKE